MWYCIILYFGEVLISIFLLCSIFYLPYLYKCIGIIPFRVIPFFLSGKSIISYWIFENCLYETDRKLLQIISNDLKWTQMISQSQNIWWIFIVLSQKFCAWTFCKQLCDIVFLQKSIDIFFWKYWNLFGKHVLYCIETK